MTNNLLNIIMQVSDDMSVLTNDELTLLISEELNIEVTPSALEELYERDKDIAMDLAKKIIDNDLDDKYLQGYVVFFIFNRDIPYIMAYLDKNIENIDYLVFGNIVECITIESEQSFGKNLSSEFLNSLVKRYNQYSDSEKKKIEETFDCFKESYSDR